jgi:hypothetical protein
VSNYRVPRLLVWYGYAIFYLGVLFFPLGLVLGIGSLLMEDGDVLSSILTASGVWGLAGGICGFGIAVSRGLRDVLIVLVIIICFVCGLVGFLFTLGRNPEIGYYLWAAAGFVSLSLVIILAVYWKQLPHGSGKF